jgi:hypothetical protein
MSRLDFYGIGPHTVFEDRSAFRLRETTFGARGWLRPSPVVRVGGNAAIYIPDLGRDANRAVPSIQEVFSTDAVPGFGVEPTFGRYRGFVEFLHGEPADSDADDPHRYGATYQIAAEAVLDHDAGRHSFQRWELEVQQRIPGFKPGQRLTLHGLVASTMSDNAVPFYMLYTLGGSGALKAFRPDLLGTDGTRSTLRSFRNFRFRDRDLVLLQAEYRIPIIKTIDATVFVDAGQVAPRRSELLKDLRTGTGFSLNYMRKGKTLGRVDIGFAGGEGIRVFWTFGGF